MNIGVAGSRNFTDTQMLWEAMSDIIRNMPAADHLEHLISGGAEGADALAADWAKRNSYQTPILIEHLPNFDRYGKPGAYFARNTEIVYGCQVGCRLHPYGSSGSDILLAFFGPAEPPMKGDRHFGSGTMDTVQKAMKRRIPVRLYFQE